MTVRKMAAILGGRGVSDGVGDVDAVLAPA